MTSRWLHRFALLLVAATYLLIVAGASVTSNRAGLSVPDWPTSYGYHMFGFPVSKMVGGIFYEHGHRLIASAVGLLTTVFALWTFFGQRNRLLRRLGLIALAGVLLQGALGGLTVLHFLPAAISVAHAGLAEAFFCLTIALAILTGRSGAGLECADSSALSGMDRQNGDKSPHSTLRWLTLATTVAVYIQIILGATIRHGEAAVFAHILGGIIVLLVAGTTSVALFVGVRRKDFILPAVALGALTFCQIWIGVVSLVLRQPKDAIGQLSPAQIWWPTAHLAVGALILACSFALTLKSWRQLAGQSSPVPARTLLDLGKPRIVAMVLVTTTLGFFLGHGEWPWLPVTLLGMALATAGAAMLNNYLERDVDATMERTRHRALPAGLIEPATALGWGVSLVLAGVLLLARGVNLLTGFLVLLAAFLYVVVYTPLKRVTWLNTTMGAIPGAIPPLAGWAAATGQLEAGAWVLFAILFAWQHPHFYAIAWMFRDDYARAGLKMLPVIEPSGRGTFRQTVLFSVLLLVVSLLPLTTGLAGQIYGGGAVVLGGALLAVSVVATRTRTIRDARRLLRASVVYLPLLLLLIFADAGF